MVPENKIFKGYLPYMAMAAILVMWPRSGEQTFVPLNYSGSIWYLALIGPVVSEKKTDDEFPYMSLCKTVTTGVGPFFTPGLQFEQTS